MTSEKSIEKKISSINALMNEMDSCDGKRKEKIIKILVKCTRYKSARVQAEAVRALGRICDERVFDVLVKALNDDHKSVVRHAAIMSLYDSGDKRAISPIRQLLKDVDPSIRVEAAEVLVKMDDKSSIKAISELLDFDDLAFEDIYYGKYKIDMFSVIGALGNLCSPDDVDAIDRITPYLAYGDKSIRRKAAWTLEKLGQPKWMDCIDFDGLDKDYYGDDLVRLANNGHHHAFTIIVKMLNSKNVSFGVELLCQLSIQKAVEPLLYVLETPRIISEKGGDMIAKALGKIGNNEVIDGLLKATNNKDKFIRRTVIVACGIMRRKSASKNSKPEDSRITEVLFNALHDDSFYVREVAVKALDSTPSIEVVQQLIETLEREIELVKSNRALGLEEVADLIVNVFVRWKYRNQELKDVIYNSLKNSSNDVKAMLLISLVRMKDKRAIGLLEELKNIVSDDIESRIETALYL